MDEEKPEPVLENQCGPDQIAVRVQRIIQNPNRYARLLTVLDELDPQGARETPLPTELPLVAPERWSRRVNRAETVPEFVRRVWGPWLDAGLLTQADLERHPVTREPLDSGLRTAIFDYCRVTGDDTASIVPPRWKKGDVKKAVALMREGNLSEALKHASAATLRAYRARDRKNDPR